jgi:hypothetical protein
VHHATVELVGQPQRQLGKLVERAHHGTGLKALLRWSQPGRTGDLLLAKTGSRFWLGSDGDVARFYELLVSAARRLRA